LEADKRHPDYAVALTYATPEDAKFYVPPNVYVIGLMNTADRSLAFVDYALRRRFAFHRLTPAFATETFKNFLETRGVDGDIVTLICDRMIKINEVISADRRHLGPNYSVGHSYFCPQGTEENLGLDWYREIVNHEVIPLLAEYWFDDRQKLEAAINTLLG